MNKKRLFLLIFTVFVAVGINAEDFEFDTDGDGKTDRWMDVELYKNWKKLDANKNDKPDESCFYEKDNKIYFIKEEKFDSAGKGKPNIWINNRVKGSDFFTEIKADEDGDGNVDFVIQKKNDIMQVQKSFNKKSGNPGFIEEYDDKGNKIKESVDNNGDGRFDDHYYFKNDLLIKEEIDSNYDGKPDVWVLFTYKADMSLDKCTIQKDNNHDGKPDEWHYTDSMRRVIKIERDLNYDGKPDEVQDLLASPK